MGVCIAVSAVEPGGQPASGARFAGVLQGPSLSGEDGLSVALDAVRSASLGGGVPADAALDGCGRVRGAGRRCPGDGAGVEGPQGPAHGRMSRPAQAAIAAGVGRAFRLRWGHAPQGLQGSHRGGHAGAPFGADPSPRPARATANRSPRCPNKYKRSLARQWNWPTWTRATPDRMQPKPQASTASGLKWPSTRWPREASCCCPNAGSWNEASPGPHASDDALATTNDSTLPSKASTSSLRHPHDSKARQCSHSKFITAARLGILTNAARLSPRTQDDCPSLGRGQRRC